LSLPINARIHHCPKKLHLAGCAQCDKMITMRPFPELNGEYSKQSL